MGWRGIGANNPHVKRMRAQLDINDTAIHDLTAYLVSLNRNVAQPPIGAKPI
jgi:hypothetical protein